MPKKPISTPTRPRRPQILQTSAADLFDVQALESRLLFSANNTAITDATLSAAAITGLQAGLTEVVKIGGALDDYGAMGDNIAGVGQSVGDLFDFGAADGSSGFLKSEFATPLISALVAGTTKASDVKTILDGLDQAEVGGNSVTIENVTGGYYAATNEYEWSFTLKGKRSDAVAFAPGSDLTAEGLSLSGNTNITVATTADFKLSIGMKADGSGFFITFTDLDFAATADTGNTLTFNVGFSAGGSLGVNNGRVQIAATVPNITFPLITPDANGRIGGAQLTALSNGLGAGEASIGTITSSLSATLPLSLGAPGSLTVLINDANLLDATTPDVQLKYFLDDAGLRNNILQILGSLDGKITAITNDAIFDQKIPLIDKTISDYLPTANFSTLLSFQTVANTYFGSTATPELGGLITALKTHLTTLGTLAGNAIDFVFNAAQKDFSVNFDLTATASTTTGVKLASFADATTALGLNLPSNVQLTVSGSAKAKFTVGLDLSSGSVSTSSAYVKVNEISAGASVAATGLNFGLNIGPMGAGVTGGTINMSAKGSVGFSDPNSDGKITIAEFTGTTVTATPSGTLDVNLPLTVNFGGYDFKVAGAAPSIHLTSANVFTAPVVVDTTTVNFDRIFNLGKMGPEQVLDLMIAAGDWATQFRDSTLFDIDIPFLDNVDLGDAFDFGLLFAKNLRDKLSNNEAQIFAVKGSATLTTAQNFLIELDDTTDAPKMITIPAGTYSNASAIVTALNTAITTAYGSTPPVRAVVEDGPDKLPATGDERVMLASAVGSSQGFSLVGSFSNLKDLGFYEGSTLATVTAGADAATSGKLSADAAFAVSVNGATPVSISIAKSVTDGNTSVADLATDVQAALTAASITSLTVTATGNKLVFTGNSGVTAFMMAATDTTLWSEFGLDQVTQAGIGTIGSVLRTDAKFATFQQLVPLLETALGMPAGTVTPSYDSATETVKLHVKFGYNPTPIQVPVSFDLELGDLASVKTIDANGNETPFKITLTPKLNAELDFGYSFKPTIAAESVKIAPSQGYVSPAGYVEGAATVTAADWDGVLGSDATFTVLLDNAVSYTLTVTAASTTTNTSVANLVADINTAIAATTGLAGKITATLLAGSGDTADRIQISTVAGTSRLLQIKTATNNAAHTELGFGLDSFGQVSDQGLTALNLSGTTVKYAPGADAHFLVSIDDAAPVTITLAKTATDANTSMADLLADLNTAISNAGLGAKLQATRFGAGDRIQFTVLGSARSLRFDTDTADVAHTKLGFSDEPIYQRLRGGEFFMENVNVSATATLAVDDLKLAAQLGFIGITTGDSSGSITLGANVTLEQSGNKRFTIGSLFAAVGEGGIGSIATFTKTGTANFSLTGVTIDAGLFSLTTSPTIGFVVNDLFATNLTITPVITDLPSLPNFSKMDFTTIFLGVKAAVDTLSNYSQFGFLNYNLPIINISVVEMFDYADKLRLAIEEIQNNPADALQLIEETIEEALGLPANLVTLSIDGDNLDALKISITLQKDYSDTLGLNLDLNDLSSLFDGALASGWDTISSVIDASAEGNIKVAAYAKAQVDFGLDLTGTTAKPFLYDTSGVEVGFRLAGQNLNLNANIGIVGLAVSGGSVLVDSDGIFDQYDKNGNFIAGGDGVIDNDFATIRYGLKDNDEPGFEEDGRHYLSESFTLADDFELTFQGQFKAELPVSLITPLGNFDLDVPITLSTTAADFAKLIQRLPGAKPIHITVPSLQDLLPEVPGIIQLIRDPSILLGGIDNVLYKIQQGLDSQTSAKLPLIGSRLSEGAQMIEEFREGFLAELTEKLRGAGDTLLEDLREMMFDFFGPTGDLDILADLNGDSEVTIDDVVLNFLKADGSLWVDGTDAPKLQEAIEFNIRLGQSYIAQIPDLELDFALPGLALELSGSPSISFDWNLYLGFGVSLSDLFYVNSKPTDDGLPKHSGNEYVDAELEADFNIRLTTNESTPFTATGTLFFLQLQAKDKKLDADNTTADDEQNFSVFNGKFTVNLNDPGIGGAADGRITFPELFKRSGSIKVIEAGLSAKADINLGLDLSVQGSKVLPRIIADFNLDWSWALGTGATPVKAGFNNVALDLGSFISDFLKPVADQINGIIKPFDPVLDALQTRIPVLSDLMGRDYTLLDLAVTFGKVDRRFIDAVLQIRGLIADIAAMPAGQPIIIPMGSIVDFGSALTTKGGTKNYDPVATGGVSSGNADLSSAPTSATNIVNRSKSVSGGGFAFPILKPANVFKLLMGQDVVLFTYDIPRLEVGMSMSAKFSIFGPLVATFKGSITAYADFAVGFDTKGLNQFKTSGDVLDILDGFYVSDRANADGTGADVPEAGMVGRIDIGGAVNLAVVEAGISGFFQLSANLDLNDPNDDGKIRGSEIIALLKYKTPDGKSYGPLNLGSITLKGEVGARAYVEVFALFSWETVWEYEFFRATIFEKTFSAPRPVPTLAQVAGDGTLQINAGTSANKRAFGSTTDVGESFTLTQLANGDIKVRFNNTETEQTLSGVKKIVFSAGKGNDVLDARGLSIPVEFDGGEGDDVLYASDGGSKLVGGLGNDEIYGGKGIDIISGGLGSDIIIGGEGDDIIEGGEGNDDITTGLGNDTLKFGDNWGVDSITFLGGTEGAKEANRDTFDFTAASAALTISVGTNQSKVVAGKSSVTVDDSVGELRKIVGGSNNDAVNINSSSELGITLDGGKGADTYSIGLGRINGLVTITDSNVSATDDDTVVVAPTANDPIALYDAKLILNKTTTNEQVNFTGIESLTVDAAKSAVRVEEALSFDNNVRLKGSTVAVKNSIDGGYIRVDSGNAIKIDADLNAHADGNIEVVVAKGDIDINANVWSSTNKTGGFTGTGAGVIQLVARTGKIITDSTGTVRADDGYLLLQGGSGSIGTDAAPILTQVATLAALTTGNGVVNIHESDGLIVGDVSIISGLTSNGGNITITNDDNSLTFNSPANAKGGDMTFTSDEVQVNAAISSTKGDLILQPLHTGTDIAIGDGVSKTFDLDVSEVGLLTDGFDSVKIGRVDGFHQVYIEDITFTDPTYIQNPILGGHVYQTGKITGTGNASLTILGSGHTTDLDNQDVVAGNIDILDSGRVRAGESIRLEADAGNININFDLDGAGSGTTEKLTLNAPNGSITIKGNVGTLNIIDELVIENAVTVRFEGNVKVGKLIIMNAGTFTVDGAVTADEIDLRTVGTVDFNSSIAATTIQHTTGTLGVATFEGAVNAPTISLSATSLIDFYQNVDAGALTLTTTGLTGDILLRQQLNATGLVTVTSLDDITFQGPVTAANLTVANVNDLAFQSTLNVSGTLTQTTGSGVSSFGSVTTGSADVNAAALVFNSSLTSLNPTGTIDLEATAGDLSITGVTNVANVFNAKASGNVTFTGNATGKTVGIDATNITYGNLSASAGGSLTLTASGAGTITGTGATNSAGALTISRAANVSLTGAITVNGAFTQGETLGFATGTTNLGQVNAASIDLRANNLTFNGTVTATTAGITLKAGAAGNISITGAVTANSGALAVTQGGTVTFSAQVDAQSANIAATQFITVANSAAFTTTGAATFTTTDTAVGEIKLTGSLAAGGVATLTSARALSLLGSVEVLSGTFTAASTINLGTGSVTTTAGDLTLVTTGAGAGNGVTASGPIDIADDFIITTPRAIALNGSIEAATIHFDAAAISLPGTVETTGALTLLAANTGNITLGSTVNAGGALTVNRVRDLTFGGLVTADSISVGAIESRVITVGTSGLNTTSDLSLRSTAATGSLAINGPLTSDAGTMTLTALGNVTTGASLNANRIVVSAANLTFNGAVTADGVAPGVNSIVIDTATAATGSVSFGSTVTSATDVIIGATRRPQTVTLSGTVNVTGDLTITSAETLTANSGVTVLRDLSVTTTSAGAGEVRFVGALSVARDFVLSAARDAFFQAAVTVSDDLTITTVDDLQFQTSLTVIDTLTQVAGTGTATYASINAGVVAVTSANVVVTNGLTTNTGDATFNPGAAGDVNIGGAVSVFGELDVVVADGVTITGSVVANTIELGSTQVRTITLGSGGVLATGNITLYATAANGAITSTGTLTSSNGILTANTSGILNAGGAVKADRVVASAASMVFGSTLEADGIGANKGIVLNATVAGAGAFNFANTVTSAENLTIGATVRPQSVTFSGTVNVTGNAAVTAAETVIANSSIFTGSDLSITTTSATVGEVRFVGAVTATRDLTLSAARDAFFQAVVGVGRNLTITTVDDVQFQAALTVTGTLTQTAGTGTATYASINAGVVVVNSANIAVNNGLTTTTGDANFNSGVNGDINIGGTVSVFGELEVERADDVTITGSVTANAVSVGSTQVRTITFGNGGVLAANNIVLNATAANGLISAGGALTSTNGILTANTTGSLTALGAVRADRVVAEAATMTFSSTLEADGTGANKGIVLDATTAAAGAISLASTVTSADSITIGATRRPASVVFTGGISAANDLLVTAAETITLTGAVNVTDDVTLTTTSTTAGEVRALSTVNISGDLTLSAARDATFQAAVTVLGEATITTADDLQFQATLTVTGTLTQTTGTGVSSFGNVLAGHVNLTAKSLQVSGSLTSQIGAIQLSATGGNVTVTGATNAATSLTVNDGVTVTLSGKATATQMLLKGGTLIAGSDLIATTDGITILSTADVTVSGETRAALDAILIDGSEDVTLQGAVIAREITMDVTSLNAAGTVSATAGALTLTTIGNLAITGATTASGRIEVTQAQSVTLSGAVSAADFKLTAVSFLAGNTLTTTVGDVDLVTTGNIRVVGLATIARDLIIRGAANVTFQGQALVTRNIQQIDGTATTRFEGVAQAAAISIKTAQQILAGSTFRALTGDIVLESDEIDFVGGTNTVQGNAQLVLRSYLAATTIDIGSPTPTGTLDISDVDINALRDGFTQIIIGRAEDATGAMLIGSSIFKDNLALHAGSIVVEANTLVGQQMSTLESLEMTARVGSITINDDVDATDIALTARDNITANSTVQGQDFVTVLAGTDGSGNVIVTATGTLEGTAAGSDVTITTGATTGDLNVAGLISAKDDVTLNAVNGAITQTAGKTVGGDLVVLSKNGITLLTTVDHIKARVTGTGDLVITDNNPDLNHVLVLGSKTDVTDGLFTADGDIYVTANANGSAFRVEASGGVFLDFGGEVFVGTVNGAPSQITGTILLDEDRTTNGEDITFDGNVRLLRDITLTSNGGNITITGRISGTVGSNFGLTLNAGAGDVLLGGRVGFDVLSDAPLGFLQINSADDVTFGNETTDLAAIRVLGDIEIHSNDVEFNSPASSVITTGGGELRLFPMISKATIDIGSPLTGVANYALGDDDLRALGNSFSLITIGQAGGLHDITLESAQFRDSLVLNGDHIRFLTSATPQSVTGVSVVNGDDDNSITINAQSQFTQGRRAAISAGRYGNISITADVMELDGLSANLIRGFGTLTLQPFTATQAITLGGAGSANDFDLTLGEIATLADGFRSITIGRVDGEHAIVIDKSLTFRDSVTIQAPVGAGSIAFGNADAATKLRTTGKGDSLTLKAAGDVTIDGSLTTAGAGTLTVIADADASGAGDLLIGQNLTAKNLTLTITTEQGAQILRGESVKIGLVPTVPKAKFGAVTLTSKTGNLLIDSNLDGDLDGGFELRNAKSVFNTAGLLTIGGDTASILVEAAKLTALKGLDLSALGNIDLTAKSTLASNLFANVTAGGNLSVLGGTKLSVKSGSFALRADRDNAIDDGNAGLLTIGDGTAISAKTTGLVSAFQIQRSAKAAVKATTLTLDQG